MTNDFQKGREYERKYEEKNMHIFMGYGLLIIGVCRIFRKKTVGRNIQWKQMKE